MAPQLGVSLTSSHGNGNGTAQFWTNNNSKVGRSFDSGGFDLGGRVNGQILPVSFCWFSLQQLLVW